MDAFCTEWGMELIYSSGIYALLYYRCRCDHTGSDINTRSPHVGLHHVHTRDDDEGLDGERIGDEESVHTDDTLEETSVDESVSEDQKLEMCYEQSLGGNCEEERTDEDSVDGRSAVDISDKESVCGDTVQESNDEEEVGGDELNAGVSDQESADVRDEDRTQEHIMVDTEQESFQKKAL